VKGQRKWSDAEIEWIKANYGKQMIKDMAIVLGRPMQSVSHQCQRLGLSPKKPLWTAAQKRKFFAEYGPKTTHQLAAELGKTEAAVRHFASRNKWGRPC